MDVLTLAGTLLRRWYVLVPVLVLTLGAVTYVALTATEWEMRGSFLMTTEPALAGVESDDPGAGAPEGDDESGAALGSVDPVLLAERLQSGDVRERVAEAGGGADYIVDVEGSLVRVTASSQDEDAVVPTVTGVFDELEGELTAQQDARDVPEERRHAVSAVNTPTDASIRVEDGGGEGEATTYTASGSVRLVNPRGEAAQANPYAESQSFTVGVLQEVLRGETALTALAQRGATGSFDWTTDDEGILRLEVLGDSEAEAQETFEGVVALARDELDRRQDAYDVPASERVDLHELSVAPEPTPLSSELLRPMLMLAGLGGAAAVGLALLADNIATGRRRRRGDSDFPSASTTHGAFPGGTSTGSETGIDFDGTRRAAPLHDEAERASQVPRPTGRS